MTTGIRRAGEGRRESGTTEPSTRGIRGPAVLSVGASVNVPAERGSSSRAEFNGEASGRDEDGPSAVWAFSMVEASHCSRIPSGSAIVRVRRLAGAAARHRGARAASPTSERRRGERDTRSSGLARDFRLRQRSAATPSIRASGAPSRYPQSVAVRVFEVALAPGRPVFASTAMPNS